MMEQPKDYMETNVLIALAEIDGAIDSSMTIPLNEPNHYVHTEFGQPLDDLRYKRDYYYGEILAIADKSVKCVGFSHWYFIPGGNAKDKQAVWRWESAYTVREKFRVGRKGILKKFE